MTADTLWTGLVRRFVAETRDILGMQMGTGVLVGFLCLLAASSASAGQDLTLDWSSYLGGQHRDFGWALNNDSQGRIYVVGETFSVDFPVTEDALNSTPDDVEGYAEGYLARISPDGTELLYATFIGASRHDVCRDVALDAEGNIYVAGITSSDDFPVTPDALDGTYACCNDVFLVKLDPTGTQLLYGTYIGGLKEDKARAVAVLAPDIVCISGHTESPTFPVTPGAFDESHNGDWDVFVTLLDISSGEILYSTFLGGQGEDESWDLAFDGLGNIYVTGYTESLDFPTTPGAFDTDPNGNDDGFVAKLDPVGGGLSYSTYLGGSDLDRTLRMAVTEEGEAIVDGFTRSANFPVTPGAYDETFDGDEDGFVLRLNAAGSDLRFSTLLGGENKDRSQGIILDGLGSIFVAGETRSDDFPPVMGPGPYPDQRGSTDVYVVQLDPMGRNIIGTFLIGGSGWEAPWDLTLASEFTLTLAGATDDQPYPTTEKSFGRTYNGGEFDGIITQVNFRRPASSTWGPSTGSPRGALRVFPNPTPRDIDVSFVLPRSGRARLDLTDVRGRHVLTLVDGWLDQGEHRLTEVLSTGHGRIPTGFYLLRLVTPSGSWSEKILLSR